MSRSTLGPLEPPVGLSIVPMHSRGLLDRVAGLSMCRCARGPPQTIRWPFRCANALLDGQTVPLRRVVHDRATLSPNRGVTENSAAVTTRIDLRMRWVLPRVGFKLALCRRDDVAVEAPRSSCRSSMVKLAGVPTTVNKMTPIDFA